MNRRFILVIGGAGLIGRSVVPKLAELGHYVTVYDSMQLGSYKGLENLDIAMIKGDTRDYEALSFAVKGEDQVLHLASPSSMLMYLENPVESVITTYLGFLNLVEACRRNNVKNLVFASTSAVYEGCPTPWREDMLVNPPDLKSLTKFHNRQIAELYGKHCGLTSVCLRPMSVYGVGEWTKGGYANVISLFVWAMLNGKRPIVWNDGKQSRDFTYVDDVADLMVKALDWNYEVQREGEMEIFNVGTGIATSFNEVISIINEQLKTNYQPIYVSVPVSPYSQTVLGDMTKVQQILNWKHKVSVKEGIAKVIEDTRQLPKSFNQYQEYALKKAG